MNGVDRDGCGVAVDGGDRDDGLRLAAVGTAGLRLASVGTTGLRLAAD